MSHHDDRHEKKHGRTRPDVAFGVDVGGTGIKGAPVDLRTGELLAERLRIPTPETSTPAAVADVIRELVSRFDLDDDVPVGIDFPAPITHGKVKFIANLDASWEGVDLRAVVTQALGRRTHVLNDADAAGYGEALFGAAADEKGTILVITLGTGIGSAIIVDGHLVPNTELGHLEIGGKDAESGASAVARERQDLSWEDWATTRLQPYFDVLDRLLSPDVIVIGGGVSKRHEKFMPLIDFHGAKALPATLRNNAGIVGAAAWAAAHAK